MSKIAADLANNLFPDRRDIPCGNDFANTERRKRYIQGYERAEKYTIERAESHLESVLLNFLDMDTVTWIIKDFKKAMEEDHE